MTGPPWPTRYPGAAWRPVRNSSTGFLLPPRGLIPHVQQGNGSLYAMFNNPDSNASSHLWLSKRGAFEQYVDLTRKAWAQAAGNPYWISVECEGFTAEDYTPVQLARLAELYAWGMSVYGWPAQVTDDPGGRGLGAHRMGGAAWGGHSCPGDLRADQRPAILAAARGLTGGATAQTTGDDMEIADLDRVATAPGQVSFGGTVKETLNVAQHTYNAAAAAANSAKAASDSAARIEAFIGSLPGNLPAPVTLAVLFDAVDALPRAELAALTNHCVGRLADSSGGTS